MNKRISANDIIGVLILVVLGSTLIIYSISTFEKYHNLILHNECINLNEYIENMSDDDSLPIGEVVSLNVNRCYGMFYRRTSGGRHRTTYYHYVVGLNDGSVMVIIATTYKEDMDRMEELTLSGEDPNSLTFYGTLNKQKKSVSTKFTDEVNYLKSAGIISQDAKVRYVSMSDGDDKAAAIMLIVFFTLMGLCLYLAAWKIYKNKTFSSLNSGNDEYKSEAEKKHDHFIKNIRLFGYTQLMLAEAERIISEYAPRNDKGREMDLSSYKDFILYSADYCCLKGDYEKAMKYLGNTSANTLNEDHDLIYKYGGVPTYEYLATKMETVRGIGDKNLAEKVMEEARPYFEIEHQNSKIKFVIEIFMYHYNMLMGDMDGAKESVDRLMTYASTKKKCIIHNVLYAKWLIASGDKDSAEEQMDIAGKKAVNNIKIIKQTYDAYKKRLVL